MSGSKQWVVTTSLDRSIDDVTNELSKTGFAVTEVLGEIGCITGDASESVAEKVRAIPGVTDVSPPEGVDIGPPDSPVTW